MKRTHDSLRFDAELGSRLRELRLRAGLSQDGLALAMGRFGKRGGTQIGQLELGKIRQPSLSLVADYLRTCRAGFGGIKDILDRYTSRPTVTEPATTKKIGELMRDLPQPVAKSMRRYDRAIAEQNRSGTGPRVDERQRLARARAVGAARFRREAVAAMLRDAVNRAGVKPTMTTVAHLSNYGQKVFGILHRTRTGKPGQRERLLARAEAALVKQDVLPLAALRFISAAAHRLYEKMEQSGELDWQPGAAALLSV